MHVGLALEGSPGTILQNGHGDRDTIVPSGKAFEGVERCHLLLCHPKCDALDDILGFVGFQKRRWRLVVPDRRPIAESSDVVGQLCGQESLKNLLIGRADAVAELARPIASIAQDPYVCRVYVYHFLSY